MIIHVMSDVAQYLVERCAQNKLAATGGIKFVLLCVEQSPHVILLNVGSKLSDIPISFPATRFQCGSDEGRKRSHQVKYSRTM
jgi:hypothetical protein